MFRMAIIGRPNVGKSALFNRICKKRIAIVDEAEGVTRDRLYAEAESFGFHFQVIDTGGIDPRSSDAFMEDIRRQANIAIKEADTLVMVVDGTVGITPLDQELARLLLQTGKPLTLAVNKIDDLSQSDRVHAFYGLGIDKIVGISAAHGYQVAELLEKSWEGFTLPDQKEEVNPGIKIGIIGRANVGKSTLVNALLSEERCVVSEIAGTTRDSVDIPITFQDRPYVLIDTAGIRRKKSEHEVVEKFAALRTDSAIERCDVCFLMLDAREGLTAQEKRIAKEIEEKGKGCILVLNKWDLVKGFRMEHCLQAIRQESHFLSHCPALFISAKQKRNLPSLFEEAERVMKAMTLRVTTHQLNKFLEKSQQLNAPPVLGGKRLRIYYMTQVGVHPPRFVLFVNQPKLMADTYKRYLVNTFRKAFPFDGAPLNFHLRGKPALTPRA